MATVKNTARGPRGLHNEAGELVMIEPGQSVEGEFSSDAIRDFKKMLEGEAGPAPTNEAPVEAGGDDGGAGPLSGSVASLKEHLEGVNDVTEIDALLAQEEAAASPRKGAIDALNARKEALSAA